MARVYFGGPSAEIDLVLEDVTKLLDAGHSITEPWWERVHEAKALGFAHDADVPDEYMAESARRNEEGLLAADAIVLRMRTQPTKVEQVLLDILAEADSDGGRVGAMRGAVSVLKAPGGPSGGLAYELGWIKGLEVGLRFLREGGALKARPIFIIGEPLRFIGIWTDPKPIVVGSIEDVIARLA